MECIHNMINQINNELFKKIKGNPKYYIMFYVINNMLQVSRNGADALSKIIGESYDMLLTCKFSGFNSSDDEESSAGKAVLERIKQNSIYKFLCRSFTKYKVNQGKTKFLNKFNHQLFHTNIESYPNEPFSCPFDLFAFV